MTRKIYDGICSANVTEGGVPMSRIENDDSRGGIGNIMMERRNG